MIDPRSRFENTGHHLFVFVGTTAIGKTHWMELMMRRYYPDLVRIRNTTTRPRRLGDASEESSYIFTSVEEFERMIRAGKFLEHTMFKGNHYGSSIGAIEAVLRKTHGVFALTPDGLQALWNKTAEYLGIVVLFLKPRSEVVLINNLIRRGVYDRAKQKEAIAKAGEFYIPDHIEHTVIDVSGTPADEPQFTSLMDYWIRPTV